MAQAPKTTTSVPMPGPGPQTQTPHPSSGDDNLPDYVKAEQEAGKSAMAEQESRLKREQEAGKKLSEQMGRGKHKETPKETPKEPPRGSSPTE